MTTENQQAPRNPLAPQVEIELHGQKFNIMFDHEAMDHIDSVFGAGQSLRKECWINVSATRVVTMLWGGIKSCHPELTLEEARKLMKGYRPNYLMEKLMEAWGISAPELDPDQPNPQEEPAEKPSV
jgi:hypothetical protein